MANTVIQLKFSDVTSAPASLNVGEAAYSNTSQKLFIGDTANNVLTIGGRFYVDQQGQIFTKTNVAFDTANSAASYANSAFTAANTGSGAVAAGSYANSAFVAANSAGVYANSGFAVSNSAASYANSAFLTANNSAGVNLTQNTNITSAASYANGAFAAANTADAKGTSAGSYANSAFLTANTPSSTANSAAAYANGAFAAANTKLSSSGGTITGNAAAGNVSANAVGYMGMPQNNLTSNYVITLADQGKHLYYNVSTNNIVYIPTTSNVAFPIGATIDIISRTSSSANVTITPNTGVSLFLAGNTTSAGRNVTTYGTATLICVEANTWFVRGSGISAL